MGKINWTLQQFNIDELTDYYKNPRSLSEKEFKQLKKSLDTFGLIDKPIINADAANTIIGGHQRKHVLEANGETECECWVPDRELTEREVEELNIRLNKNTGSWDFDTLANEFELDDLLDWGFDKGELDLDLWAEDAPEDVEPQIDKAEELRVKWGVESGQLWQLGEHRLICGDCTDRAVVERVMGGERAVLIHADPPYGMGKENEGIENDNLYREKLDEFQMQWWKACRPFIADNGSAYIWGDSEGLWRLWYCGGLRDSERLTFRNEIYWVQEGTSWGRSGMTGLRQYAENGERCLFFMLGEQGFNNNADNYWDGWEGIRSSLLEDCEKMGWKAKDIERICGVGMYSHWFTKSQWTLIPEEHYKKLQAAAREYDAFKREYDAFKREYDELKQEFYATRAYFNNPISDNCSDVWSFERVKGDERGGHATPKPLAMIERIIKSSAPEKALVLVPFGGTMPELIACERLGRKCRAVEISPAYVAVAIQRWVDVTGGEPVLVE